VTSNTNHEFHFQITAHSFQAENRELQYNKNAYKLSQNNMKLNTKFTHKSCSLSLLHNNEKNFTRQVYHLIQKHSNISWTRNSISIIQSPKILHLNIQPHQVIKKC